MRVQVQMERIGLRSQNFDPQFTHICSGMAVCPFSSDHSPVVPKCTMLVVVCNPRGHFAMMMAEMDTNPACLETAPNSTDTLDLACLINRFLYLPSFLSLIAIEDILHT
jgi:hypothetical protein